MMGCVVVAVVVVYGGGGGGGMSRLQTTHYPVLVPLQLISDSRPDQTRPETAAAMSRAHTGRHRQ